MTAEQRIVLITGISGFVGTHVCKVFMEDGSYLVRGTVRSERSKQKLGPLKALLPHKFSDVEIVLLDLQSQEQIDAAIKGCDYIIHTASLFNDASAYASHDSAALQPAVKSTLAILKTAVKYKIKRVVITASVSNVGIIENKKELYTEDDWSDPSQCSVYERSKLLAERAAWDFLKSLKPEEHKPELVVLNGGYAFGPNITPTQFAVGGSIITFCLSRWIPGVPKIMIPIVDVRDFAQAHLLSLNVEEAKNNRFLIVNENWWLKNIMEELKPFYGQHYFIPNRELGYILYRLASIMDTQMSMALPWWNIQYSYKNKKSKKVLGLQYRPIPDSLNEMTSSLIESGLLPNKFPARL